MFDLGRVRESEQVEPAADELRNRSDGVPSQEMMMIEPSPHVIDE